MAQFQAISGQPVNEPGNTVLGIDLALGIGKDHDGGSAGQTIKGISASDPIGNRAGRYDERHPSLNNSMASLPSGYNLDMSIDYGDGVMNINTVWGADHEQIGKGEFSYYKPSGIVSEDYNNLTS